MKRRAPISPRPGAGAPRTARPAGRGLAAALTLAAGLHLGAGPGLAPTAAQAETLTGRPMATATATETREDAATLVADSIRLAPGDVLLAEGAVEVFYRGNHLTAESIRYDGKTDRIFVTGPLRLTEPGAEGAVILADQAEMSTDLRDGLLTGARMVLAREMQLAAATISRVSGRYTDLNRVVASSCRICADNPTPLWEIRADRLRHDTEKRQLLFDGAEFRALGLPIARIPHLRMPDPTVKRMTGFLTPSFRTTSGLGTGVKLPYFIVLGDHRDLTLTPYVSSDGMTTMGFRYRAATHSGLYAIEGALSRDDLIADTTRGYLFAQGRFALPDGFSLGLDLQLASDRSYLLDYGISDADRLWSGITLERVRRTELTWARLGQVYTMREGESNDLEPVQAVDAHKIRVFRPALIGGELEFDLSAHAHRRPSDLDVAGRDMARLGFSAQWRRNALLPGGILAAGLFDVTGNIYRIGQDSRYDETVSQTVPAAGVELRWPWVRQAGSAALVIEPVAQLLWSDTTRPRVPNEDSLLVEFDEGDLFSFSRFPGEDAREGGTRANLGISFTRFDAAGWSLGMTAGRVVRARAQAGFGTGSGLSGVQSDWLLAAHFASAGGLAVSNRALISGDFGDVTRNELRVAWSPGDDRSLSAGYLWMKPDLSEGRPSATSELTLDTTWRLSAGWSGRFASRYDFDAGRAARAGLGLRYENECVTLDLSLSRRYTSSTSVRPETDFGVSVALAGFGAGENRARRVCTR
ncbi:LPS-assembly protein LptD [Phaeovulum vinaykumarii]|uniref:LPS-assembly protein LptD n=1 Tax=Phaeovulum vinaykumarii TaxID=407234 RepID=A0A1N7K4H2_9RHOB|nr:LPS assembly protein LptD [Phaeovulum vinaykumarii]SIS56493.1 LPS-assembly protein [Phaeovulum vinaykumarii]SOB92895.1 LPS-assembly protein [Phaeovulum vinaykumarii]